MKNNINIFNFSFTEILDSLKSAVFISGALIALSYWIIDPFIDALLFKRGTFLQELTTTDDHEIYMRSLFSTTVLIICFIFSFLLNRSRQVEKNYRKVRRNTAVCWKPLRMASRL